MEICRDDGRLLRAFSFAECAGGAGQEFRGVARGALLRALEQQLPPGTVRYGAGVQRISEQPGAAPGAGSVVVGLQGGQELRCRLLVGADGVRSAVAQHLALPAPGYAGYIAFRGVATMLGGLPIPATTIRQLWGQGVRAGLYALNERQVYWYTCVNAPLEAPLPAGPAEVAAAAAAPVAGWCWGIGDVIAATPSDQISRSRIVDRWTAGAFGKGGVTLAGDAAHPQTPNLGQGGCTALEDAVVLARALHQAGGVTGGTEEALQVIACPRLQHTL